MEDLLSFDHENFDNLFLANPTRLQGGAYFSKLFLNENTPVIFQTPKSSTKNGLIITSKKTYCDLLFNSDNQKFIQWVEAFEQAIQFLIYEKKDLWFHNDMELEDIEYFFNPSIRLYNKNKYLLRSYIRQPKHIKKSSDLQIYDENENILTPQDVKKDQKIISILEVLGIKFTASSFSIDYCLRQIMIIDEKPLFNKCLIKPKYIANTPENKTEENKKWKISPEENQTDENQTDENQTDENQNMKVSLIINDLSNNDLSNNDIVNNDENEVVNNDEKNDENIDGDKDEDVKGTKNVNEVGDKNQKFPKLIEDKKNEEENNEPAQENIKEEVAAEMKQISLEDSNQPKILEKFKKEIKKEEHLENSLTEIDISNMNPNDTIKLKKPNEVYLKIYKEARKKAKKARQEAIESFLEAKRIKNTYLVGEIDSDDSNSDVDEIFTDLV